MDLPQLGGAQQAVLVELGLDQAEGQPRRPDLGNRHVSHQVGQRADVVFVTVREHDCLDRVGTVAQVAEVRQDEVHPEVLVPRKRQAGVHDDDRAFALVGGHVLADLTEAAQGDDPAGIGHRRQSKRRG